jgi:hypothetical protein
VNISGDNVALGRVVISRVPRDQRSADGEAGNVIVEALDSNKAVIGRGSTPDRRINVQEGVGVVIVEDRSVSVVVPLTRRPLAVTVTLPDSPKQPHTFELESIGDLYCKKFSNDPICLEQSKGLSHPLAAPDRLRTQFQSP